MARGRLYVGTSGFAYKQWKPDFYPADLKNADMLAYYSRALSSVEINNTFYRLPSKKVLDGWKSQVPESFVFTLKASRRITHLERLRDVEEPLGYLLDSARTLGGRLGCLLFQCPPNLTRKDDRLEAFLATLPRKGFRFAFEFRHPSWEEPEVAGALADGGVARCLVEDEERRAGELHPGPGFVYLRLRRAGYDRPAIRTWAKRLGPILDAGADAYVYFKHEDDPSGVRYGQQLMKLLG